MAPPIKCKKIKLDTGSMGGSRGGGSGMDQIARIHHELEQLEEKKIRLEEKMQRMLHGIAQMCPKICQAEKDAEKALHDKLAKECQLRMKCEITRLCEDQKRTERILLKYDEQLQQKYKAFKRCAGSSCDDL